MTYGESLLSKTIDHNDPAALKRFRVEPYHFLTEVERKAYEFITDYAEKNRGQAPDYRTLVAEVDEFTYIPNVSDSFDWLAERLKNEAGKRDLKHFLTSKKLPQKFDDMTSEEFIAWLQSQTEDIRRKIDTNNKVGTDVTRDIDKFISEYDRRKAGESFRIWKSKFPSINESISGYFSGNMYTWYGRSGRGKSIFVMEEALEAAAQGANVLIWALEMSWFEWMARAYSSLSAREGVLKATIDGVDYEAGFKNQDILTAQLPPDFEENFKEFLKEFPEKFPGEINVRSVDDEDFYRRDLKQLEADIEATKAEVVVIDPFYYLDYERNTSKTTGGDAANTSSRLRHLAGRTGSVIHAITQAEEDANEKNKDKRELKAPSRSEIKKTKQVLEDASCTFGIDTLDGLGVIEVGKGRAGGEGDTVEVIYLPSYGIVKEMEVTQEAENF